MAYYKIINGIRLDRQLLDLADRFRQGRGEDRISFEEASALFRCAQDGRRITLVERRTLQFLLEEYPLTAKAATWLREALEELDATEPAAAAIIDQEFGLAGLSLDADAAEIEKQNAISPVVSFPQALREALQSYLTDAAHPESPQNMVRMAHAELAEDQFDTAEALQKAVRLKVTEYLKNGGRLFLIPLDYEQLPPDDLLFNPPEDREPSRENWIFSLSLPALSDHIYWAVVDRTAQRETYNYGFN